MDVEHLFAKTIWKINISLIVEHGKYDTFTGDINLRKQLLIFSS